MIWVVNASPVITLAKADLHDLMVNPPDRVPDAVALEIEAGSEDDPARVLLSAGFGERLKRSSIPESVMEWGLGAGESAVIAEVLRRPGTVAVLDDAVARRCARGLGIPVAGTLGIIIRAKRNGRIEAAASCFLALRRAGLYFSDEIAQATLAAVDETWS